jgi:hypothetical protein
LNDLHQPRLHHEDLDDALSDLVQALGGFKQVGPKLWPTMPQQDSAQRLRHCLNKSRREKLDHHETVQLLRWAREVGFHGAKFFIDDQTGYQRGDPLDPKDERLRAIEAVQSAAAELRRATEMLERTHISVRSLKPV